MKNFKKLTIGFLFIFIMNSVSVISQDLGAWTSIGLEYKLNKKLSFNLEEELRFKDDISAVDEYFTELGAEYNLTKQFSIGAAARYIKENDNVGNIQGYEDHFRFQFDAAFKHKLNQFSLKYRARYQNKNELGLGQSDGDFAKEHFRFKTSIDYNIKNWKLDPEISFELFNQFGENQKSQLDKYRIAIGTDYDLKDYGKINLFYHFQKDLNTNNPTKTNIIGLKYKYTIK